MPFAPKHPCGQPGCGALVERGKSRCAKHAAEQGKRYDAERLSAAARGYDRTWRRLRRMVLNRSPLCAECGDPAIEVHHVIALADGGENTFENLESLCKGCHSRKTRRERASL